LPKQHPYSDRSTSRPGDWPPAPTDAQSRPVGRATSAQAVEASDVEQVIVDLAGLTFVDSSGVHLIARAEERCRTTAKRLGLRPGPPQIQRVFALAA